MGQGSQARSRSRSELLSSEIREGPLPAPIEHAPALIFQLILSFPPPLRFPYWSQPTLPEPPARQHFPQPGPPGPLRPRATPGPARSPFLSSCFTVRSGSSASPEGPSMSSRAAPPPLPLPWVRAPRWGMSPGPRRVLFSRGAPGQRSHASALGAALPSALLENGGGGGRKTQTYTTQQQTVIKI